MPKTWQEEQDRLAQFRKERQERIDQIVQGILYHTENENEDEVIVALERVLNALRVARMSRQ